MSIDISKIRNDFPILNEKVNGKNLIYFDNAATTQKPNCVIDTIVEHYRKYNSNIHRGVHYLSNFMTEANEKARENIKNFLNADSSEEIIFTSGTTEGINLVASSYSEAFLNEGDEIIVSELEHHSNIVPWQIVAERKNAKIKVLPMDDDGNLILNDLKKIITDKTKLITVSHISNALGSINPIEEIIKTAHDNNIHVLIDGAQSVQHVNVDVKALDCDFYVFSGHKIYGPTGTGVLYGKKDLLNKMPPYKGGGEMVEKVSFEKTSFNKLPFKFEAGTPNYIDIVGLDAAINYIKSIGIENIKEYEDELLRYATNEISKIKAVNIIGNAKKKSSLISFTFDKMHFYDVGVLLDQMGVAIRTGSHCAETVMQHYNIEGTARASFAFYNTKEEIDYFINGLSKIESMFA